MRAEVRAEVRTEVRAEMRAEGEAMDLTGTQTVWLSSVWRGQ